MRSLGSIPQLTLRQKLGRLNSEQDGMASARMKTSISSKKHYPSGHKPIFLTVKQNRIQGGSNYLRKSQTKASLGARVSDLVPVAKSDRKMLQQVNGLSAA